QSIPPDTAHAISVSLPTWKANIGYEEGQEWVVSKLETGYPRFAFLPRSESPIMLSCSPALSLHVELHHGRPGQRAMLFSTSSSAVRCVAYIRHYASCDVAASEDILDLVVDATKCSSPLLRWLSPTLHVAFFDKEAYCFAKQYWQHTGDGVSSRRAEFYLDLLRNDILIPLPVDNPTQGWSQKGPRRYRPKSTSFNRTVTDTRLSSCRHVGEDEESHRFLEERFGRNLDLGMIDQAKVAVRRRIAGLLTQDNDIQNGFRLPSSGPSSEARRAVKDNDVFLFPNGMNAIFNVHRTLLAAHGQLPSVSFGFPYVDTLKILQKFGPGCLFLGRGSSDDLDELESLLRSGERYLALFCEFPGNPLLTCPDLQRIRSLADRFDFAVVVDETIGTFANINVLPLADVVVSSLTKIFSGESNVMGGGAIFNPQGKHYTLLKRVMSEEIYEDAYWPEDMIFMERNSRDFLPRVRRINVNAEAICRVLRGSPLVKSLYYPMFNPSKDHYDAQRQPQGGYGGLVSVVFHRRKQAHAFFDAINTAKGPSLGTNFTLCSPYVILAHYQELAWAAEFGVDSDLVRISVGLEETENLRSTFRMALKEAEQGN
ncbi:hypothetical protein CP533_4135, partial [Ophiocordyceps camponoti-saundersi (nom. inval.)]